MKNNTTGVPSTTEYMLGRGKIKVAEITSGVATAYYALGNATEFNITPEIEDLEHYSTQTGAKTLDYTVLLSSKASLSLTIENINQRNMKWFLMGEQTAYTNPTVAGITDIAIVAAGDIVLGTYVNLTKADGSRCYDIDASKLTVKTTTSPTPVELAKDTDYSVSAVEGQIFLLSTSTKLATAIAATEGLTATLTADTTCIASMYKVDAFTANDRKFKVQFIADDPKDNSKTEYLFFSVALRPNGDYSLIGDEFKTLAFTGKAEVPDGETSICDVTAIAEV